KRPTFRTADPVDGKIARSGKGRYKRDRGLAREAPSLEFRGNGVSEPVDSQEAVFRFLADPKTHGLAEPVVRVDTANAVVFLAGPDAYKVKRAVKFPFMDLSTLDKRRASISRRCRSCARAPTWRSGAGATSSNGLRTCAGSTRTRRSTGSPSAAVCRTRSSTSSRWRSGAPTPGGRCATLRGRRTSSRSISSKT